GPSRACPGMAAYNAAMIRNIAAYHFVDIADPAALAAAVHVRAEKHGLLGSVLVAGEGINLFLAGEVAQIAAFLAWLRRDARFAALQVKDSDSVSRPFAERSEERRVGEQCR